MLFTRCRRSKRRRSGFQWIVFRNDVAGEFAEHTALKDNSTRHTTSYSRPRDDILERQRQQVALLNIPKTRCSHGQSHGTLRLLLF